jgi:hypothetical protein
MRKRIVWIIALGLLLVGLLPCQGYTSDATTKNQAAAVKATAAERPAGLVGTIAAIVPGSRTVVVDVPLATEILRLGAEVTKETEILMAGAPASFEDLEKGARVRVDVRRMTTGDEAVSVEILERLEH